MTEQNSSCASTFSTAPYPNLQSRSLQECAARTLHTPECKEGKGQGLFQYDPNQQPQDRCKCCLSRSSSRGQNMYSIEGPESINPDMQDKIVMIEKQFSCASSVSTVSYRNLQSNSIQECAASTMNTQECKDGKGFDLFQYDPTQEQPQDRCKCCLSVSSNQGENVYAIRPKSEINQLNTQVEVSDTVKKIKQNTICLNSTRQEYFITTFQQCLDFTLENRNCRNSNGIFYYNRGHCGCCINGISAVSQSKRADGNLYQYQSKTFNAAKDLSQAGKYRRLVGACAISRGRQVDMATLEMQTIDKQKNGTKSKLAPTCSWYCDNLPDCTAFQLNKKKQNCVLFGDTDIDTTWPDDSSECFIFDGRKVDHKIFNRYLRENDGKEVFQTGDYDDNQETSFESLHILPVCVWNDTPGNIFVSVQEEKTTLTKSDISLSYGNKLSFGSGISRSRGEQMSTSASDTQSSSAAGSASLSAKQSSSENFEVYQGQSSSGSSSGSGSVGFDLFSASGSASSSNSQSSQLGVGLGSSQSSEASAAVSGEASQSTGQSRSFAYGSSSSDAANMSASAEESVSVQEAVEFDNIVREAGLMRVLPDQMYCRSFQKWFTEDEDMEWNQYTKRVKKVLSTREFWVNVIEEGVPKPAVSNHADYFHSCGGIRNDGNIWKLYSYTSDKGLKSIVKPSNFKSSDKQCSSHNQLIGGFQ